ncbi:MAG: response regulator [Pseudomonadota bacterium]
MNAVGNTALNPDSGEPQYLLVVEDDDLDVELIRRCMREAEHPATIVHAPHGQAALDILYSPDSELNGKRVAVTIDLNMPRMTGLELIEKLRSEAAFTGLPLFVFSGSELASDIDRAKSLNVNGYVTKPTGLRDMKDAVATLMRFLQLIHISPYKPPAI